MSLLNFLPEIVVFLETTIPPNDTTETSVIPAPISTIRCPLASVKRSPHPIAMANAFSTRYMFFPPAFRITSIVALDWTSVEFALTPTIIFGAKKKLERLCFSFMSVSIYLSNFSAISKSDTTPLAIGSIIEMYEGVLLHL